VEWAARIFARALADHLGAELRGFAAGAAGERGAADEADEPERERA
jgi:hypothetical protein